MGAQQVHRYRGRNKTLGVIGLGNIGRDRGRARDRAQDEGLGYDPIPDRRSGGANRGRDGDARAALPARRFHYGAHAPDPRHQIAGGRGGVCDDEAGRADHQLRARRNRRRAGARRARSRRARWPARRSTSLSKSLPPKDHPLLQFDSVIATPASGRGDRRSANSGRDRYRAADRRISDQWRDQPFGQHARALAQGTGNAGTSSAPGRAAGRALPRSLSRSRRRKSPSASEARQRGSRPSRSQRRRSRAC